MRITIEGENHQEVAQVLHALGTGAPLDVQYPPVDQKDWSYPTPGHQVTVTVTVPHRVATRPTIRP